jgi:hypothetical protein
MTSEQARKLLGTRTRRELRFIVERNSMLPEMNSLKEQRELAAARVLLAGGKKKGA